MRADKVYSIGVIGLGVFGARHASVCLHHPNFHLVGVADIKEEVVKKYSSEFDVAGFTDNCDLLAVPELDAVTIAVSDQFHHEPCKDAAKKGIHIFLEKPIADNSVHAQEIISAARKNNVKLMVGQHSALIRGIWRSREPLMKENWERSSMCMQGAMPP
jgi:predicted dehydrogenase